MPVKDETKLPVWARDMLTQQRRLLAELHDRLAVAEGHDAEGASGRVMADTLGQTGFRLRDRARVTFLVRGHKVHVMLRGEVLDINSEWSIKLRPRAANTVWVDIEDHE